MAAVYKFPRGLRTNLTALAVAGQLIPYQGYYLTDESRFIVADSASTYSEMAKRTDVTAHTVTSRTDLANFAPVANQSVFLKEGKRSGVFTYSSSNHSANVTADTQQGLYVAPTGDTTGATGAWVREVTGPINPMWFGIQTGNGNGATNSTALTALFATLRTRAVNISTFYQGLETVHFPGGYFEFSETIDITAGTLIFEGEDTGGPSARGTRLKFPSGVTGIRVQRYNTSGATTTDVVTHKGSDGTVIRNLSLTGAFGGTEAEAHGIQSRAKVYIQDVYIESFEGDGIHINTTSGGETNEGNSNYSRIIGGNISSNRRGIYINGADANVISVIGTSVVSNRTWGVMDSCFLGNYYAGVHSSGNGISTAAALIAPTVVSHSSNRYYVIAGQEAWCSTNAPSGTTASNQGWAYQGAGAVGTGIPAWSNGTTYRAGGSYHTNSNNAENLFDGCYVEGGQGRAQLIVPTIVIGGNLANATHGDDVAQFSGTKILAPFAKFKEALISATTSSTSLFTVHQNQALTSSIRARMGLATGFEADGVTPATWVRFSGRANGSDVATAAGIFTVETRNAGGTFTEVVRVHSTALEPVTTNTISLGGSSTRWSTIYGTTLNVNGTGTHTIGATTIDANGINLAAGDNIKFNAIPMDFASAQPSTGTWPLGAVVYNSEPSAAEPVGWRCIAAGTPGTWEVIPLGGSGGTVADDSITDAKLRNSVALSVIGRSADTDGDPADIVASQAGMVLRRSGTSIGFGQLDLSSAFSTTNRLSLSKVATIPTATLLGRTSASTGDIETLTADQARALTDPWTTVKLAADFVAANTNTFANVTDGTTTLTFTPPANSDWEMEARLMIETATATNLPRVGVNIGASATNGYGAVNIWQAGATATASVHVNGNWKNNGAAVNIQVPAGGVLAANVPNLVEIIASGRSGATPQPITIQLANETAAATMGKVLRGSFIKHRVF